MADPRPLVLDVDGTFLKTDMLFESFWAGLGRDPIATLGALRHLGDRPRLKGELARIGQPNVALMPVNADILALADAARDEGRQVVLASASDAALVRKLADAHGVVDNSMGSHGGVNLKSAVKADALAERYGRAAFDYAGNEPVDRPVWDKAHGVVIVGDLPTHAKALRAEGHPVTELPGGWSWSQARRALRTHQYVKNVLLFLPVIAAHAFNWQAFGLVLLGIVAFSAAASSIYIINDLLDLEADRLHATKRNRPFASGAVPIQVGMALFVACLGVALGLGAMLGSGFLATVGVYILLSLAYSLRLKRMRWIDVFCLATLYTLRVVAGATASGVEATTTMLVFVFPVFVTLGCVKRLTELAKATDDAKLPGRGYARADYTDLMNMAGVGVVGALVIFALYTVSDQAAQLYQTRWIMWLALLPIALWLFRMVALGARGQMDYDPIVFALRDRQGLGLLAITLSLMFWSAGLWAEWLG
ncbi:UbiA family prenyltransferase [Maribius pontilimi]|uniref:UbiA family prenyltransferase n=1 Tax=Palleronia pontilimi TaxID=1964209 RepID=A0A934IDL4_9RHOB|nr:UbiA family prenyltransferase [Palleronia pontilimi]MBJ3761247.1 UbiA family prenyltransferase [Palleronia pontilimi]